MTKYRIYELSARAVMSYAAEEYGQYMFRLNRTATEKCKIQTASHEQDSNALFFQIMCELHGNEYQEIGDGQILSDLSDIIFYMDFEHIFDRSGTKKMQLIRQQKAEAMFRPEGVGLDFGSGEHRYLAFERSNSMSRQARLSFIRSDYYDAVRRRIMLDMEIGQCQLSKLYAYNGLMLSSGTRVEGIGIDRPHRVIVIDNPITTEHNVPVITVEDDGSQSNLRRYHRVEKRMDIDTLSFDGEGIISKEYAATLDRAYCGQHTHTSFQIRLPYIKGMLHQVDFKDFLKSAGTDTITDIYGVAHRVQDVDIILTKSQFKGFGWLRDCGMTWEDYWAVFRKYHHALYVTNVSKEKPESFTELNYQFLTTVSIRAEEFRPRDLPDGWKRSPAEDTRQWLTKETETAYYNFCANEQFRQDYFLEALDKRSLFHKSKAYILASVLKKDPLFIHEPIYTQKLDSMADRILKQYTVGRLIVAGDNRYLSGDLLEFMTGLLLPQNVRTHRNSTYFAASMSDHFTGESFFAPGAAYEHNSVDWDKVDSNVERLPYLAHQLKKNTPKIKPKPAADSELFTFAQAPDWKEQLDRGILSAVSSLLEDYETCLSRIRTSRVPIRDKQRKSDVDRILYSRGQEDTYDPDELYALFQQLEPERITALRQAIREQCWHFMGEAEREQFLLEQLPEAEFTVYYDLLADFRFGGFRILGDLVCDIDDENTAQGRKHLLREADSPAFVAMMQAFIDQPFANYRDTVAVRCRKLLDGIVRPALAVRYVVAVGKRDLLWELLIDQIEKNVLQREADYAK